MISLVKKCASGSHDKDTAPEATPTHTFNGKPICQWCAHMWQHDCC